MFSSPIIKPTLVAVFTAEALVSNYAMTGLPNVKIMDALIFIAAFLFGWRVGVGTAVLTWTIYGFVNPYGQAGFPLILFLMIGECFYAIGGAALRRASIARQLLEEKRFSSDLGIVLIFGTTGLVLTLAYDVLTNFATYLFVSSSLLQALIVGVVTGAPFALLHEVSNLVFFAAVSPAAIVATRQFAKNQGGRLAE